MLKLESFDKIMVPLLAFIPVSVALDMLHFDPIIVFLSAAIAIIPIAGYMGKATEELAKHLGAGLGGLLNATFGNATELIIAFFAIQAGLFEVVKASITGAIVGNLLLIMGCSMLFGGLKRDTQKFNAQSQGISSTMLMLGAVGLVLPALVSHLPLGFGSESIESLSLGISGVLLLTYVCSLVFSLKTHKHLYEACEADPEECKPHWPMKTAVAVLVLATLAVAVESEILVGSIEHVSQTLGLTELFIGVIVVAIIGNAAEHSTAILMAIKNKMDLSMNIAMGSSTQIALLIAPALVFVSWLLGTPMDLVFNEFEVVAVVASVVIANMISFDGESNWLEGIQLIALYAMMAAVFFFIK